MKIRLRNINYIISNSYFLLFYVSDLKLISPERTAFSIPFSSLTIRSPVSEREIHVTISSLL